MTEPGSFRRKLGAIGFAGLAALLASCSPKTEAPGPKTPEASTPAVTLKVPAGTYELDVNHAYLVWTIEHFGVSHYMARFAKLDATLTLDPANLTASKVSATIDPLSVRTIYEGDYKATHPKSEYPTWDAELARSPLFLNGGKFPQITFTSTKVEQSGPRTGRMTGDLTFLGVTRPVTLDVTFVGDLASHPMRYVPVIGFSARGEFKRSDFGMPAGGPLGDLVTIAFDGEFSGQPPQN